jgi:hypothetical protein
MNAIPASFAATARALRRPMYVVARDPSLRFDDLATAVPGRGVVIASLCSRHLWAPLLAIIERNCPELAASIDAIAADELDDAGRALAEWELEFARRIPEGSIVNRVLGRSNPNARLAEMSSEVHCWIEQISRAISPEDLDSRELAEARAQAVATASEAWRVIRPLLELHAVVPCEDHSHPLLDVIEEATLAMERAMELLSPRYGEHGEIDCVRNCIRLLAHSAPEHPSIAEIVTDGAIGRADRLFVRLRRMFCPQAVVLLRKDTEFYEDASKRVDGFVRGHSSAFARTDSAVTSSVDAAATTGTCAPPGAGPSSEPESDPEEPEKTLDGEAGLSLNISRLQLSYRDAELAFDGKKDRLFAVLRILVKNQGKFVPLSRFSQAPSPWKPNAPTATVLSSTVKRLRALLRSANSKHLDALAAMIECKDSEGFVGYRLRTEEQHAEATGNRSRRARRSSGG